MNRIRRGLNAAIDASRLSTQKYRVGAAIYKGNRLISIGWNKRKTAPTNNSIFKWHHAETSALIGTSKLDLSRATIYVARTTNQLARIKMAKPCQQCQIALLAAGIKNVVFTNRHNNYQKMTLYYDL